LTNIKRIKFFIKGLNSTLNQKLGKKSFEYYSDQYWNDLPRIQNYINQSTTDNPNLTWIKDILIRFKKYVPFNNEEGWHVPNIILQQIEHAEMQKFKTVTMPNGEKQLEPYITKKFNVRVLDPLTPEDMDKLAASQAANPSFHTGVN